MEEAKKILVVDDDKEIAEAISIYLTQEGYETDMAYDGLQAVDKLLKNDYHLAIMDIMMPNLDGIRATIRVREEKKLPIIMLTAKSENTDKIMGLNMGADDYITKPFEPLELIARVRSQLRRYTELGSVVSESGRIIKINSITLDMDMRQVFVDGEEVRLTPIEFKILSLLMQNPGKIFSIDEIYEKVWQEPSFNCDNTVAVHIRRIREKIEINPKEPKYLKVVWGIGYKFEKN